MVLTSNLFKILLQKAYYISLFAYGVTFIYIRQGFDGIEADEEILVNNYSCTLPCSVAVYRTDLF